MSHMPATGVSGIDIYARDKSGKWIYQGTGRPEKASNASTFNVVPGSECILYLPLYNGLKSIEIGIPKGKTLSTPDLSVAKRGKPVVFYGTSIIQGGCASRPGLAAVSIVSRELDVPVVNLGFSGNGRMEQALADLLAELDPSIYVIDCLWNMEPGLVNERVEPFVKTLRKARPNTPIVLVEDSSVKGISPTEKGRVLRAVYDKLTKEGIKGIHFLPNTGMLGADSEGTVDGCHHNDLGMMRQADALSKVLRPLLKVASDNGKL
jgi:lysophospholipase L1-like esterase